MALGGGTFVTQNKDLPGAYINFISAASANAALSERGIATMPLDLDWGVDGEVFEVTNGDFQKNSMEIFGYEYTNDKLKGLRDLFLNTKTLYAYKLTSGGAKAADLVANKFVTWKDAELTVTAATPLSGGSNGAVDGAAYQAYLDKIESYTYNTMGVVVTDETTKTLFASFVKRLRDEMGIKFQLVLYNKAADYYGTINVKNKVTDEGWSEASLVYWVTGVSAGCEVNRSNQNKVYNGEFTVDTNYTQNQLAAAIKAGEFTLHKVGSDVRVLEDINSMVTTSDTQGDIFKDNQTIRVIDQIANDIAVLFNTKYLGVVPNDNAGRTSLWSDIVKHHQQLNDIRAIEDFADSDVSVAQGNTKKSVVVTDAVTVVNAMGKLYMTVTVA